MTLLFFGNLEIVYAETEIAPESETETFASRYSDLPGHLNIDIIVADFQNDYSSTTKLKKDYIFGCKRLSNALAVGRGPWGFGVFSTISCRIDFDPNKASKDQLGWLLRVSRKDNIVQVSLMDAQNKVVKILSVENRRGFLKFLLDREYTDLIGLYFLDSLPFAGILDTEKLDLHDGFQNRGMALSPKGLSKFGKISPPDFLNVYSVKFDSDIAKPRLRAKLKFDAEDLPKVPKRSKKKTELSRNLFSKIKWKMMKEMLADSSQETTWIHNAEGSGFFSAQTVRLIEEATSSLNEAEENNYLSDYIAGDTIESILGRYQGGYIGLRYGFQLIPGDPLMKNASFFGLVGELRSGLLGGLRFYFDKMPEKKFTDDDLRYSMAWERFIIGKSFGYQLKYAPKIGLWNLKLRSPVVIYDSDLTESKVNGDFRMSNALSGALELGLEWYSQGYALRTWGGIDRGIAISRLGSKNVTSVRIGLDGIVKAGPKARIWGENFRTAFLFFLMGERLALEDKTVQNINDGDAEISGLNLEGGYAGAGMAVSW
ncbi:MAG: hypothetical protein NT027_00575 [Proteobacteria bacterium]|nr:hypothetical protein [Pseudomonadota bacterium]